MKQLIQSYKTGELGVYEVPAPICGENGVLVRTKTSLVSAGTEKMIVDLAKKSLLGKAKARPDLVKQVVNKMKQEGVDPDILDKEPSSLFSTIYNSLYEALESKSVPQAVLIIAGYQYKAAFVADQEINMVACLTEIMANCNFK